MSTVPLRRLVRPAKIADAYDLSERTLRDWVAKGRLTAYRIGDRAIRFDPDEVEALVSRRLPTASHAAPARPKLATPQQGRPTRPRTRPAVDGAA